MSKWGVGENVRKFIINPLPPQLFQDLSSIAYLDSSMTLAVGMRYTLLYLSCSRMTSLDMAMKGLIMAPSRHEEQTGGAAQFETSRNTYNNLPINPSSLEFRGYLGDTRVQLE